MFNTLNEVTYESFGIDTVEFYKNKFNKVPHHDYFAIPENKFLLGSSRIRFICKHLNGGRVLDIGCGGGPFGMTLKENKYVDYLVGVDFDSECIKTAEEHYDEVHAMGITYNLPFEDNSFDAVISSDFFGHIEFKYKDAIISEIYRVLKPGGKTIHTIESGIIDYLNCDQNNPDDPVRKYVYIDGHIGVDSELQVKQRFSKYFKDVVIQNAMLFPFFTVQGFINNEDVFGKDFADILRKFTPAEAQAADVVSGYICEYIQNALLQQNSNSLDITEDTNIPDIFRRSCGTVFLVASK